MSRPKPDMRSPEYLAYADLFTDITETDHGAGARGPLFSARRRIADHLWDLGYRKTTPTHRPDRDQTER